MVLIHQHTSRTLPSRACAIMYVTKAVEYNCLPMEWLFSWEVTSWVVALLVALGFAFLGMDDYRLAKLFFLLSAADAIGGIEMWGISTAMPAWQRNVIVFVVVGGTGVLLVQSFNYVHKRRHAKEHPQAHITEKLPGFAAHAVIKLSDISAVRRKYVFDVGTPEGSRSSFYLSASDLFTFAVMDIKGETYPLEVKVGHNGVPLGQFVYVLCEIGVGNDTSTMSVLVNGKEVAYRIIPRVIDLGSCDWKTGTLGANQEGKDFGAFALAEFFMFSITQTPDEQDKLNRYIESKYAIKIN